MGAADTDAIAAKPMAKVGARIEFSMAVRARPVSGHLDVRVEISIPVLGHLLDKGRPLRRIFCDFVS